MAYVQKYPFGVGALFDDKNPMYAIRRAHMLDANNKAEAESMRDLEKMRNAKADA